MWSGPFPGSFLLKVLSKGHHVVTDGYLGRGVSVCVCVRGMTDGLEAQSSVCGCVRREGGNGFVPFGERSKK